MSDAKVRPLIITIYRQDIVVVAGKTSRHNNESNQNPNFRMVEGFGDEKQFII